METERPTAINVDKLISVEMRSEGTVPSGVIHRLYDAAREEAGEPLTWGASRALVRAIDPGDAVLVATGSGTPPWLPRGETDGPQGAVGLAHGLAIALGARPVLVTEERHVPPLRAAVHACGLNDVPFEQLLRRENAATVVSHPVDADADPEASEALFERVDPAAVVAVEKTGPNAEGVYHSLLGSAQNEGKAKMAPLFDLAADRGVLTVGVGDGGNEIGFGRIEDAVREIQPWGDACECPCEGGVATRVATDHLVVGGTSNWGAYGVQAMVAVLAETPEAMHSPDAEIRMLEHSVVAGSSDGIHARPVMMVDGTSAATQRGMVAMLNDVVENRLTTIERDF